MLLGEPIRAFHESLSQLASTTPDFQYYYVTAREMACLVHQVEDGAAVPLFNKFATPDSR